MNSANIPFLLVPNLQIGNALVPETPFPCRVEFEYPHCLPSRTKQSFEDTGIPNLEIGNEEFF